MLGGQIPNNTILTCKDPFQLSELCGYLVPRIWTTTTEKSTYLRFNKRNNALFKQYCQKLFRDTQISCGCIILALYYLHQLKTILTSTNNQQQNNNTTSFLLKSESHLFTISLMLANKFLDDNTFTNKTWSEVSGIPIIELNLMEMQYLSIINYKIYVHCIRFCSWATQCQQWLDQLKTFHFLSFTNNCSSSSPTSSISSPSESSESSTSSLSSLSLSSPSPTSLSSILSIPTLITSNNNNDSSSSSCLRSKRSLNQYDTNNIQRFNKKRMILPIPKPLHHPYYHYQHHSNNSDNNSTQQHHHHHHHHHPYLPINKNHHHHNHFQFMNNNNNMNNNTNMNNMNFTSIIEPSSMISWPISSMPMFSHHHGTTATAALNAAYATYHHHHHNNHPTHLVNRIRCLEIE